MLLEILLTLTMAAVPEAKPEVAAPNLVVPRMILVLGAPGSEEFGELFQKWADPWEQAAAKGPVSTTVIGRDSDGPSDRERLQIAIVEAANPGTSELWLVFVGHGTFDRRSAKFNLRGPDISADDLKTWLADVKVPTAVIDCSAASAPFLQTLSSPQRVIVTATKSGGEQNFARFGEFLSAAIADPTADLDKDDQTSLWEAYLAASRRLDEFYKLDGRLQTEHPLLDDNGDGQGTRADAFQGLEAVQSSADGKTALDGRRAHQWHLVRSAAEQSLPVEIRRRRDELELQILALRLEKSAVSADEYYQRLEILLVELARLNRQTDTPTKTAAP